MKIDQRLLEPNGEPELIENFNRVVQLIQQGGGSIKIDTSLTKSGEAADAKAAGDSIVSLEQKTVDATTEKSGLMSATDKMKLDGIAEQANKYVLPQATTSAFGGVKKSANVAKAAAENITKAEFDALIDALIEAGIMEGGT